MDVFGLYEGEKTNKKKTMGFQCNPVLFQILIASDIFSLYYVFGQHLKLNCHSNKICDEISVSFPNVNRRLKKLSCFREKRAATLPAFYRGKYVTFKEQGKILVHINPNRTTVLVSDAIGTRWRVSEWFNLHFLLCITSELLRMVLTFKKFVIPG